MAVPKRRVSRTKVRSRRASHKTHVTAVGACPECGSDKQPHRVCPNKECGYYKGKQVMTVEAD